jgi:hypothetical protein
MRAKVGHGSQRLRGRAMLDAERAPS